MTADINSMTDARNRQGPTVSAGYARALFELAVKLGADPVALGGQAGLTLSALDDPDARVPFTRFKALMRAGKALSGEPALALRFGAASPLQKISIVGLAAYAAETVAGALTQLNRFGRLVVEAEGLGAEDRFVLVRQDGGTWLEDRRADPNAFPELTESTWARFIREFAHFHPGRPYVKAVHVTHPPPAHAAAYPEALGAPVTFDSDRNALLVDDDWPNWRIGRPNRYVFGVFSRHAEDLLRSLEAAASLRARIERLLIPILHTGETGMDRIAREMGLSRATLYRRLRTEGLSYEDLLDDLRARMARHYLDGQKVSLAEAAYLTGFSDPSAFSRAYLRWTGRRPGAARRAPQRS
jgi:AraC-like DNA-binding protein